MTKLEMSIHKSWRENRKWLHKQFIEYINNTKSPMWLAYLPKIEVIKKIKFPTIIQMQKREGGVYIYSLVTHLQSITISSRATKITEKRERDWEEESFHCAEKFDCAVFSWVLNEWEAKVW